MSNSYHHISTNGRTPPHPHKTVINLQFLYSLETLALQILRGGNSTFINLLKKISLCTATEMIPTIEMIPATEMIPTTKNNTYSQWK